MARKAAAIGHEYIALTDHSPRLRIAHGLEPERLRAQLDLVAELNRELAPFRVLTGIEVDINEDGSLDQEPELLAQVDVVVASVHSKLAMERSAMTDRMLAALASPHVDILGHCTGRMVTGRGRPESEFDSDLVFMCAKKFDKAIEINCRPERLDPPRRMLRRIVELDVKVAIDTDAHATDQLDWQPFGCDRAVECEVPLPSIVNAWPLDDLLAWTATHAAGVTTF
jgi:putative hydrolase